MLLKNWRKYRATTVCLGAFSGPLGIERCVFVGFGPKCTSGAEFVKIGFNDGTGVRPSLMDGLLRSRHGVGETLVGIWKMSQARLIAISTD